MFSVIDKSIVSLNFVDIFDIIISNIIHGLGADKDMARREVMTAAQNANKNEFYTQYKDIEKEVNSYVEYDKDVFRDKIILLPCDDPEWSNFTKYFAANFERFGIKKLISTSYARGWANNHQITLFELNSPEYDASKHERHGKKFVLERDTDGSGHINQKDIEFEYLDGDGDFRSEEVTALRDEADIIITNPPFNTLFREFFAWIMEAKKKFLCIASINSITYKEVFPYIKNNEIWLGTGMGRWISGFIVPSDYSTHGSEAKILDNGQKIVATNSCLWLTNLDHCKRHEPLTLMTMADNLKYNKTLIKKLDKVYKSKEYQVYDNYDAIEVPVTEAIPSDYDGIMGVPITFLDKYNPDQFEIIGLGNSRDNFTPNKDYTNAKNILKNGKIVAGGAINCVLAVKLNFTPVGEIYYTSDETEVLHAPYARILIKHKKVGDENE